MSILEALHRTSPVAAELAPAKPGSQCSDALSYSHSRPAPPVAAKASVVVPTDDFDTAMAGFAEAGTVASKDQTAQDVTEPGKSGADGTGFLAARPGAASSAPIRSP